MVLNEIGQYKSGRNPLAKILTRGSLNCFWKSRVPLMSMEIGGKRKEQKN